MIKVNSSFETRCACFPTRWTLGLGYLPFLFTRLILNRPGTHCRHNLSSRMIRHAACNSGATGNFHRSGKIPASERVFALDSTVNDYDKHGRESALTRPTSYQLQESTQDVSASEYVDLRPVAKLMTRASCSRLRMVIFTGNGSFKVP